MVALRQHSNPLHLRDALEMERRRRFAEIETQSVQAIRLVTPLPESPYVTQPIPLAELMPWETELKPVPAPVKPRTTNKMLPIDDLGRPYVRVTEPDEIDTAALARMAIERYVRFEGKHPFVLVFSKALRYLHIHKPFMTINGACIPCMYEPDAEASYDVMARG